MKYVMVFILGFKTTILYKKNIMIEVCLALFNIYILIYFWNYIYKDQLENFIYMEKYVVISEVLVVAYSSIAPHRLVKQIRTGDVIIEMVKPWNFLLSLFAEEIGNILARLIIHGTVIFFVSTTLLSIDFPNLTRIIIFLIFTIFSSIILFIIRISMALLAFWFTEANAILILTDTIISVFSGKFIPSWIVPIYLKKVMEAGPFIWLYQIPIQIFLDKKGIESRGNEIGIMLIWLILFGILLYLIWKIVIKKINIQGG